MTHLRDVIELVHPLRLNINVEPRRALPCSSCWGFAILKTRIEPEDTLVCALFMLLLGVPDDDDDDDYDDDDDDYLKTFSFHVPTTFMSRGTS